MIDVTFKEQIEDFSKHIDVKLVKKIIAFDEIPSTNTKAKKLAQTGGGEGTIVIAQIQKQGRGRFERDWESPSGGLYLSIILKPHVTSEKTTLLPLIASLAVAKAIQSFDFAPTIKWPNDVRINGKKVAGILLESESDGNKIQYVVLGIGINLNIEKFSHEIGHMATSLLQEKGKPVDYFRFLEVLLSNIDLYYSIFLKEEFEKLLSEWKVHSDTIGRKVKIVTSKEEIEGLAKDIDQSGFLHIVTNLGEQKKILSGDCLYLEEL